MRFGPHATGKGQAMTQSQYQPMRADEVVKDLGGTSLTRIGNTAQAPARSVPCFLSGTRIVTQAGLVVIEDLTPGDRVLTRDNGYQTLRWIGMSSRHALGANAPVEISAGTFGNHEDVCFSRNHRVLVHSSEAATLFGEGEVLIKAGDLINNTSVRLLSSGQPVTYVHLLFERHEIVRANGLDCESYHPSHETLDSFDPATRKEILSHMPNSDRFMGYGYGPAARVSLRAQEAKALLHAA